MNATTDQPYQGTLDKEFFDNAVSKSTLDDWQYEMRREMQEILPGLYLGPLSVCKDTIGLQTNGITHILCFLDALETNLFKSTQTLSNYFHFKAVEISDSNTQNLISSFPSVSTEIKNVLQHSNGKILVCCNGGMSRSPCFVIAYVMETFELGAVQAYNFVQSKRLCINPKENFKSQLKEYEPIYQARNVRVPETLEDLERQRRRRRPAPEDDMEGVGSENKRLTRTDDLQNRNMANAAFTSSNMPI
ncbi:protein-tyrosine phosphatase-like protein [Phycomyces blakesleeanus]|uniref:Uncharacterized protein n=1 Tax=Phycomyces blakesleeanus (strain ATCC 8743b / DSM 1359 / FGSC 10004 / NBRC 33097 / NRRL 1555) TaxID=763407 RepID=A0A162U793_PHYB8|nr:hypothetical protein PHYBLDRAFT_77955 [Phycomyces blakesleeanus NRRL 1555(-)]OAD72953.1 hypothetical protein PHYBLDRAFT_77955 [Phycomyces blakesleeanus NRRL 1555(-)]|eukprot:XP_018290993.1 hypothetical protein PHYBLDRAFT_77955 [Phycomyces blakesleeanus NRRL 1555(-)]